ncbi:unnamed protein product [Adineta ricciae]|uniref:GH18 domain-containing protein n=1 Tax=Adineta ricciae TaxID=249248 RepID=A0A814VFR2_ADIRI|nr:unnamed protein product [Adineta ricciae]
MVASPIIVAYFVAWSIYRRSYFVNDIPADKITHINYAFANISSDGRIAIGDPWADIKKPFEGDIGNQSLQGNFNQLIKLKEKYPHLRTLISVGGGTRSGKFSDIAASHRSRSIFAASCVKFIQKYGFDGIDLDWEYPVSGGLATNSRRPQDKQNYVFLLRELRHQLDAVSDKNYLLTAATGATAKTIANMDLPGMIPYLDWINVMTYDFHGGWEATTGHNAPLYKNDGEAVSDIAPSFIKSKYNCDAAIQAYLAAGVPSEKVLLGLPLYGRGWQGVTNIDRDGFSQPASSQLPTGTWENGVFDYDHLKKSYIPFYNRYWDNESKVPFLYNPLAAIWISYDDVESINFKNNYINQNRLGGAFFWQLSSDRQAELISATFNALNKDNLSSITTTKRTSLTSPSFAKICPWKPKVQYKIGHRVMYNGKVYRCIKTHTSVAKKTPPLNCSLWRLEIVRALMTTIKQVKTTTTTEKITTTIQLSDQNTSSQWTPFKLYLVGDQVIYEGKSYRCRQSHTSLSDWMPPVVPALWWKI